MSSIVDTDELVQRIWARDPTVWTGHDEAEWLGWLDEPARMRERLPELRELVRDVSAYVLLGMGGSSLAPEVLRRAFDAEHFHVLDTTHPAAIRRLEESLDVGDTLFIAASKSGTTIETRCHLDYFLGRGSRFAAITDPGTELERLARERRFEWVVSGEPTVGGRYSALSPFGLAPAALMGLDLDRLLDRADEMVDACRLAEGNPGLELGTSLGAGWQEGRDKVLVGSGVDGFGLWVEQLLAESTGKDGKGLVPVLEGVAQPDVQAHEARLPGPYELGQEFFRWEFATAVAGSILGVNPFDQPNVQEAKDRTSAILASGRDAELAPEGSVDGILATAREGDYVCIQAFIDPAAEAQLDDLVAEAQKTGCVVTKGLGPRYLHSTGQLHKGGPNTGIFIQVVDGLGDELAIPGRDFGFRRLIRAQAAGDFDALAERGRRIARVRLEDV